MILSVLSNASGFFSTFFFTLNHYIFCKKNKKNFIIHDKYWTFKYKNGWTDYFKDCSLYFTEDKDRQMQQCGHTTELGKYTLIDYKNIIREIYNYNDHVANLIQERKQKYNLIDNNYDSIFIRHGDKLIWESKLIPTTKYIELLLEKNPNCTTIYLQTDDYNCYLELQEYIHLHQLNIRIICFCDPKYKGGMVMNRYNIVNGLIPASQQNDSRNQPYVSSHMSQYQTNKPVTEMNPDEIFEHTLEMIIGLDIVFHSKFCILDYQSNVSRFIKLAHNNMDNVIDVYAPDIPINMNSNKCPAFGFDHYDTLTIK